MKTSAEILDQLTQGELFALADHYELEAQDQHDRANRTHNEDVKGFCAAMAEDHARFVKIFRDAARAKK